MKRVVGMLLFEGFELLDVFGPLELFGLLREGSGEVELVSMAEKAGEVRSAQAIRAVADRGIAEMDRVDILLLPGGVGTRKVVKQDALLAEVRRLAEGATYVGSICTGAAILARLGMLDGRSATTNKLAYRWVVSQGPQVNWIPQARWVEDGKFFTAAGVSAGMDMALALIAKVWGLPVAGKVALLAEYEWHRNADWDPFAKRAGLID